MEQKEVKKILLKHRIQIIICGLLVFVATITAFFLLQNKLESLIPMAIIAFAAIRILRLISGLLYIKNIQSILTKELNPQKFKAALLQGNVTSKSLMEHAMAAFYTGDYQTAVNICFSAKSVKGNVKFKNSYLTLLARCYFETGNYEKLAEVVNDFERDMYASANPEKIANRFTLIPFYSMYLKGDFKGCKYLYQGLLNHPRNASPFQQIHVRYSYAIACYKCGDLAEAAEHFKYVAEGAPQFNIAQKSKEYLDAINNGEEYVNKGEEILPDANYINPCYEKNRRKIKRVRIVTIVLSVMMVIAGVVAVCFSVNSFNSKARTAVADYYDDFKILTVLEIDQNDRQVASLCLADTKDDGIVATYFFTYEGDKRYYSDPRYMINLKVGHEYRYTSSCYTDNNVTVTFSITDKADDVFDKSVKAYGVTIDGKKHFVLVSGVETVN